MKDNIPFSKFYEYYKQEEDTKFQFSKEKTNRQTQWLNAMADVTWEDLESLKPDEMIKIPIAWIYDWTHVTANYILQDQVQSLYNRYHLPIYSIKEYLSFFK